jgi:hypothetical protein
MKLLIVQLPPFSCSSFLCPNILLRTLFSNTSVYVCSSLSVRDQVPQPYKTAGRIMVLYILTFEPGSSVGIVLTTDWTFGRSGFVPRQGQRIFPLTSVSRPAMEPTQLPVQWVPGVLSPGKARPGRDADHSPPSSAEVRN